MNTNFSFWHVYFRLLCIAPLILAFLEGVTIDARAQTAAVYMITDLGTPADSYCCACGINNAGQVVGYNDSNGTRATLYSVSGSAVTRVDLGTLGGTTSNAYSINNSSQAVGYSSLSGNTAMHATLFSVNGSVVSRTDLGTLGGTSSRAQRINSAGQIVGSSSVNGISVNHAALFNINGSVVSSTDLGTLGGTNSGAFGINESGQIVGFSNLSGNSVTHATLFSVNGSVVSRTDLGTLGGTNSYACGINNAGQIVGYSNPSGNNGTHATLFSVNGSVVSRTDLGTLGGTSSYACGINNAGQIVGYSDRNSGFNHGFVYTPATGMQDINNLVGANPIATNITVFSVDQSGFADAINDKGQIAATGTVNGQTHALLLTPAQEPLIFLPGIAGSKFIGGSATGQAGANPGYLWPTIESTDIYALNLHTGAQNVSAVGIVTEFGNLALGYAIKQVYSDLVNHITGSKTGQLNYVPFDLNEDRTRLTSDYMLTQGYGSATNPLPRYFPFPYDWRQSYASHVATLHAYITNIRKLYGNAKVNIIAHSAGGLLIRRYILQYPDDIDRVITIGSPFLGAPQAIYRMLSGNFYDSGVDWITRPAMQYSLVSLPGSHELLPSDLYLDNSGSPVFLEDHWDLNGDRLSDSYGRQTYTSAQYKAMIDAQVKQIEASLAVPDLPAENNIAFHSYANSNKQQDNWSTDDSSVKYLHICGLQNVDATTLAVIAKAETRFGWTPFPQQVFRFRETLGAGDGVVPLFSAQRLPQFLAPGAITRVVSGANDDVEHTELTRNPTVYSMIDAFLSGNTVPTAPSAPAGIRIAKRHIEITGCGYVTLFNTANYQNTKLSDLAAKQIPGVTVHYGGSDPWVDIDADSSVDLTVQGATADQVIEVAVTQLDADGKPLSSWRYQLSPTGKEWQAFFPPSSGSSGTSARLWTNAVTAPDPVVSVDSNGNGTFEVKEQIAPAYSSGGGPVDTTPPTLDMTISPTVGSLTVNLIAHDDGSAAPTILYTLNDGPVQTYRAPLNFASANVTVLKAFAQDGAGNTSGMVTTAVNPTITAQGTTSSLFLQWPQADAYVLEQTDSLVGTWSRSAAQITRNGMIESATVPAGASKQQFFRLRSQTVTK